MTDSAGGERLDRIETNLETVSEALVRVSRVVESNREDIDQVFERLDQLSASVDQVATLVVRSVETANADRAVMREILEYLRNRYPGNGMGERQ